MPPIVYVKTLHLNRLAVSLRVAESRFRCAPSGEPSDVDAALWLHEPVRGWRSYRRATRLIDLQRSPDELFGDCSKSNRYEIERARRSDDVVVEFRAPSVPADADEFADYYDRFAATKGVAPLRRSQAHAIAEAGRLVLTGARHEERWLAAHAYYVDGDRARLTHSASLFRTEESAPERARVGRANRLLHWEDMVRFRELGMATYDLGGWYMGTGNEALLRINSFKKQFGGTIVAEWDSFRARSLRGWVYLRARDALQHDD